MTTLNSSASETMAHPELVANSPTQSENSAAYNQSGIFGHDYQFPTLQNESIRRAGRLNASLITEEEHQELLTERQLLLDLKMEGTMTSKQSNRLEYVRWSLDRIEDAKHGAELDVVETAVLRYKQALNELQDLRSSLTRELKAAQSNAPKVHRGRRVW